MRVYLAARRQARGNIRVTATTIDYLFRHIEPLAP